MYETLDDPRADRRGSQLLDTGVRLSDELQNLQRTVAALGEKMEPLLLSARAPMSEQDSEPEPEGSQVMLGLRDAIRLTRAICSDVTDLTERLQA